MPQAATRVVPANTVPFCAKRGRQWLTHEDLQAHLATLLRVENVGVLLGSGASMGSLGGLTMDELWKRFAATNQESLAWLQAQGFVDQTAAPNVELLADALEIAAIEWKRSNRRAFSKLEKARRELQKEVIKAALLQQGWWEDPSAANLDASELADHRAMLQKLTAARQPGQPAPWLFTTNYDLSLEWAAESIGLKLINGFEGLHRRVFSPQNFDLGWRNVLARGEARFGTYYAYLVKVHGSLTWQLAPDGTVVELPSVSRWPEFRDFLASKTGPLASVVVLPSTTKYLQTVGFVLGELVRRFSEFLARPQAALFTSGYSFRDEHLNRLLVTALQNPTLQLVIYLPEASRVGEALDLSMASDWVKRLLALESPQVTIVGGKPQAHFSSLATDLPDPAIFDEQAAKIRSVLKDLASSRNGGGSQP